MEWKEKTGSNMKEKTSLKKRIVKIGGILLAVIILGFMGKEYIQTVWGTGYKFVLDNSES